MIALAYLLGLVAGPLVAVVGGLALITFGRALLLDRVPAARSALALAVVAGALGVAALRWGSLDLVELRGVQSVLGPTILVGPTAAAAAGCVAGAAGLLALSSWLFEVRAASRGALIWTVVEAGVWSLALVTVFFDPARSALQGAGLGGAAIEIGRWLGAVVVVGGLGFGLGLLHQRLPGGVRWGTLGTAVVAVTGAALVVGGVQ